MDFYFLSYLPPATFAWRVVIRWSADAHKNQPGHSAVGTKCSTTEPARSVGSGRDLKYHTEAVEALVAGRRIQIAGGVEQHAAIRVACRFGLEAMNHLLGPSPLRVRDQLDHRAATCTPLIPA